MAFDFEKYGIKPWSKTPNERQLAHMVMERKAFFHFGVNTLTGKEWGLGDEVESLFNPTAPDIIICKLPFSLTRTVFVNINTKIRHTSFKIHRISEKPFFRATLEGRFRFEAGYSQSEEFSACHRLAS